ncbi:MAG: VWA domain-containing protein, partial [Planctomyces sp.]
MTFGINPISEKPETCAIRRPSSRFRRMAKFVGFTILHVPESRLCAVMHVLRVFAGNSFRGCPRTSVDYSLPPSATDGCKSIVVSQTQRSGLYLRGMLMRNLFDSAVRFGVCFAAFCQTASADQNAAAPSPTAVIHRYGSDSDNQYLALAVRANRPAGVTLKHVILIDTSASQTGWYREVGRKMLQEIVASLPENHRVRIYAADSSVTSLNSDFVSPTSASVREAIQALSSRTPLGATDLSAALRTVRNSDNDGTPLSVLYIGDGLSSAKLLSQESVQSLVSEYQTSRTAFHAALLGPILGTELTASLANHTGGTM